MFFGCEIIFTMAERGVDHAVGTCPVSLSTLEALAVEYGTPYYLLDEAHMRARVQHLLKRWGSLQVALAGVDVGV